MMRLAILCVFLALSPAVACPQGSWVEPLSRDHAQMRLEWLDAESIKRVDDADRLRAIELLTSKQALSLTGRELLKLLPRSGSDVDPSQRYLLLRATTDSYNDSYSLGFDGASAYSVFVPLGVCRELINTAVIVKSERAVDNVHVLCAPTI